MNKFARESISALQAASTTPDRELECIEVGGRVAYTREDDEYLWGESVQRRRHESMRREGIYAKTGGGYGQRP